VGRRAARAAGALLGWLVATVAICAGVGWLYLLRDSGGLAAGPSLSGALPLQELAAQGAQPLLRMAVAWLPAGFAAGLAVRLSTRLPALWVSAGCGLLAAVILGGTTAASEALIHNERVAAHLRSGIEQPGVWAAVALVVIGSLLALAVVAAGPRGRAAAATGAGASGPAAA
jgi:hypothetical protein